MCGSSHQNSADDEDETTDLKCPFATNLLGNKEAKKRAEKGACLESGCDVARYVIGLGFGHVEVSLEARASDGRPNEGRVITESEQSVT